MRLFVPAIVTGVMIAVLLSVVHQMDKNAHEAITTSYACGLLRAQGEEPTFCVPYRQAALRSGLVVE